MLLQTPSSAYSRIQGWPNIDTISHSVVLQLPLLHKYFHINIWNQLIVQHLTKSQNFPNMDVTLYIHPERQQICYVRAIEFNKNTPQCNTSANILNRKIHKKIWRCLLTNDMAALMCRCTNHTLTQYIINNCVYISQQHLSRDRLKMHELRDGMSKLLTLDLKLAHSSKNVGAP
jgi:hypothetical protein